MHVKLGSCNIFWKKFLLTFDHILICYLTKKIIIRQFHEKVTIVPGYMISWLFLYLAVPWMSAVWFVVVDTFLILYMRDSVLMFFNVFLKNKSIIQWQGEGVKIAKARQKKNISIICPLHTVVVWLLSRIGGFLRDYTYKSCLECFMVIWWCYLNLLRNDSLLKIAKKKKFNRFYKKIWPKMKFI